MGGGFWRLIDHYIVLCLFLALFVLLLLGVGDVRTVSLLGLILCALGLAQAPAVAAAGAKIDGWVLGPLLVYNLLSAVASWGTFGNIADGYAGCQLIWLLLYLLLVGLSSEEQIWLRRLCAGLAGLVALIGLGQFTYAALAEGSARRLAFFLGNPNALGIFLVLGWFIWQGYRPEPEAVFGKRRKLILRLWFAVEAVLLMALALTLSLGSFLAMAVGIVILVAGRKAQGGYAAAAYLAQLLAKATLGVGMGLLLYLAAARTDYPWLCLPLLLYAGVLLAGWWDFGRFLAVKPKVAAGLTALGSLVAAGLVLVRPSSLATFAERLQMMRNGLHYCWQNPLWGVGPYQWRGLNMQDADKFFNTWHIHNVLIHVGVELGLLAAGALLILAIRVWLKHKQPEIRAEFGAFLTHCLLDTSFFYLGITAMVMLTVAQPSQASGIRLSCWVWRLLFGILAVLFVWNWRCFAK